MQTLATYQRPAFLNDHPPVIVRMSVSGTAGATLPAGSVLGRSKDGVAGPWAKGDAACGILAGDVEIPASGKALADVYIHASVGAEELIFAAGVSAEEKLEALAALRLVGIYSAVTWAPAGEDEAPEQGGQNPETPKEGE